MRTIYHGSPVIVQKPTLSVGKTYNDYGQGFYCTEHIELAKEWACLLGKSGYVNQYEIDESDLKILDLSEEPYSILHWLTLLVEHRQFRLSTPLMRNGVQWLRGYYHIDLSQYDVVIGYRADDSYFSFARAFLNNTITLEQLGRAMHLGKLGEQVVIRSVRAYEALMYLGAAPAIRGVWYARRMARDKAARDAFRTVQKETPLLDAVYIVDIIREKWQNDDPRIQ